MMNTKLDALRRGATVEVDGLRLRMRVGQANGQLLQPHDMYFAQGGIYTVARLHTDSTGQVQHVESVQGSRHFDPAHCVGVEVSGITAAFDTVEQLEF